MHLLIDKKSVETLLDINADVNKIRKSRVRETALYQAVFAGHREIVSILLERGASIDAVDDNGFTLIHYACKHGNVSIVEILLEHSVNFNIRTIEDTGATAGITLHLTVSEDGEEIVALLLARGV